MLILQKKIIPYTLVISVLLLFMMGTASATIYNDWFEDNSLNTSIWTWKVAPDRSYDEGTTRTGYLFVDATNNAELIQTGLGDYTNYTLETEVNSNLMDGNYEYIYMKMYNGTNSYSIRVSRSYGTRDIKSYNGASTINTAGGISAIDTENLKLRIKKVTDGSGTRLDFSYALDNGVWVPLTSSYSSAYSSFDNVSLLFDDGGALDSESYVNYFTFTDDDTGISIPAEPYVPPNYAVTVSETYRYINIDDVRLQNLTQLHEYLDYYHPPASDYLTEVSPGNWESKYAIFCLDGDNGKHFTIDADTFKVDNTIGSGSYSRRALIGNITIAPGTHLIGWDFSKNQRHEYTNTSETYDTTGYVWLSQPCSDVIFDTFRTVSIGRDYEASWPNADHIAVTGQTLEDITVYNTSTINYFHGSGNTYRNFSFSSAEPAHMGGFASLSFQNCLLENLYVNCPGSESSLGYGLWVYPVNSVVRDVNIVHAIYSGVNINGLATDTASRFENITVQESEHNNFEIQASNVTIDGYVGNNSKYHDIFTAGKQEDSITISGIRMYNWSSSHAGSHSLMIGEGTTDSLFMHGDIVGSGIYIFNSWDNVISNVTHVNNLVDSDSSNERSGIYVTRVTGQNFSETYNNTFVDIRTSNNGYKSIWHYYGHNIAYANVDTSNGIDFSTGNFSMLYPLNLRVLNTTNYSVSNALIAVDSLGTSMNYLGQQATTGYTNETGYLNASQMLYVADYLRDSSAGYTYYTFNATASKSGQTDSETSLNPDSTWLNSGGTLIALVLDVAGDEPAQQPDSETPTFTVTTFIVSSFVAASLAVSSFLNRRRK